MTAAIGANGQPYLEVRYDDRGRVLESRTGREYAFDYRSDRTVVTEGTGQRHTFERNADGTTVAFDSTTDTNWRVLLNANNRVKRLTTPSRTINYDYDAAGRIRMVEDSIDGRRDHFHDDQGRLVSVRSLHGEELLSVSYGRRSVHLTEGRLGFSYELTRSGRIETVWGVLRLDAEYDANDLSAVRSNGRTVRFQRDELGRVVATTHPSGFRSRYNYDLLGNRRLVEYDDGSSVAYSHDPAGNIVGAEVTEKDGTTTRQTTTVGRMNRVERIEYDPVRFAETTFDAVPLDPEETDVPYLAAARDLRDFALPLFGSEEHTIPAFEKPSNPLFQPAEYRSTNCCVNNVGSSCDPSGPLGGYGGGELTPRQIAESLGIEVKDDADLSILTEHMVEIFDDVLDVWAEHAPGVTPVITSGREWARGRLENSKHYTGNAFDLRTRYFTQTQRRTLARALQSAIGRDYQVLIKTKPPHLHVEYDPD